MAGKVVRPIYSPKPTKRFTQDPRERAMSVVEKSRADNDARARAAQIALQYGGGPDYGGGGGGGGYRSGGGGGDSGGGGGGFDIAAAIANARAQAAAQEADYRQRGRNAEAATGKLFQGLSNTVTGLNAGINKMYVDETEKTQQRGQSLIDGILKSNEAAIAGTKSLLSEAGIGGVDKGVDFTGMSQNLGVESDIARGDASTNDQNMNMTTTAQRLLGENAVSGIAYDRDQKKEEIQDTINKMVAEIQSNLSRFISNARSYGSRGGGGGYSRGGGGGGSRGSGGVGLPSDAFPIPEHLTGSVASGKLSLQNVSDYLARLEGRTGINLPGVKGKKAPPPRPTTTVYSRASGSGSRGRRGGSGSF